MRTDVGEHSEWLDLTQGLRQRCMPSPLLFVSSSLLTHAVEVRYSEDPDVVRNLVHLEEDLEDNADGVN